MPRMTLRAAAMSVLLAAWSSPSVKADDRPAIHRFSAPPAAKAEEQTESGKPSRWFSLPFGKKSDGLSKSDERSTESSQPPIRRFAAPAPAKQVEQPSEPEQPSRVAATFGRLKQAVGFNRKEKQADVAPASHESAGVKTAHATKTVEARTAAYNDALPVPADPVAPPAEVPGNITAPAYEPVPVPNYAAGRAVVPGYPYLNAPLNPCPIPNVPYQVGSTIVTNQALYPHELQYPHEYRALYPPFYYKVRGGWMVTPWGVWSHDRWELQGTEVKVKYRSHYSIHSMFTPPMIK